MSTTVCQTNIQPSRFGSWLLEPRLIGFDLSLSSRSCPLRPALLDNQYWATHDPNIDNDIKNDFNTKNPTKNEGLGGWSFLQALSDTTLKDKKEKEEVYVHPLVKKSSSTLSEKSLEMCTESLGSETGSNLSENGDDLIPALVLESERSQRMPCFGGVRRRAGGGGGGSFPPPLTTIRNGGSCGSVGGGVRVKSEREGGRLVIKAVSVGTHKSCFKAERKDGWLKLHFVPRDDDDEYDEESFDHDGCYDEEDFGYDHDDIGNDEEFDDGANGGGDDNEVDNDNGRREDMSSWEPYWMTTSS